MQRSFMIFVSVFSIVRNDSYTTQYDGIVYPTQEEADNVIRSVRDSLSPCITEIYVRDVTDLVSSYKEEEKTCTH